ncbi:ATP-binding protein [Streptomyces sp. IBSBF 3010]|uniref:ATP-binding protein n=1 Tax=Streptomyces sp. IBSBF 3010 TaxID=2903526 RepID=UPI002FDC4703
MTETQTPPAYAIEGPVRESRFGSVGFRLADPLAPSACRKAARQLLHTFRLEWVPDLVEDVEVMVSELVTNACNHTGDDAPFPAGSLTIWHPNTRLIIAVHDKNPYQPWREIHQARKGGMSEQARSYFENGRGLAIVHELAQRHLGTLDTAPDGDKRIPGKVITVNMLLPNVSWSHTFRDPWRNRTVTGRP